MASASISTPSPPLSRLLLLPRELRDHILKYLLDPRYNRETDECCHTKYTFRLSVLRVCRQIHSEGVSLHRRFNHFASITTPWPEAEEHISHQGFVPILIKPSAVADRFKQETLKIEIEAPQHRRMEHPSRKFILHLDDVARFAEMWYYSDLTHPGLNEHLCLTLRICNPFDKTAQVSKAMQQRLLEPFGRVKNLVQVNVVGDAEQQVYPSVEAAMRKEMRAAHKDPELCLEEATSLKDEGNAAIAKGKFAEAVQKYVEAFRAIHIVIEGRRRSIWGDAVFHREMAYGRFKGQHGQMVRVTLRVRLVANMVQAYLKLEEWVEAKFWGMRSIRIIEDQFDSDGHEEFEHVWPEIVPRAEVGKIYYRTACARRKLRETDEAYALLQKALEYLPNDKIVKTELDEVGKEAEQAKGL